MSNFNIDPNMGFPNPIPGVDPGPDYALNNQTSLTVIGAHNHTTGKGVQVPAAGLNINADLPINNHNLTLVKTVNFGALLSPLSGVSPNLGCIYVAGNELYYNDEAGNVVQVTNNGSVNAGPGSIAGLPSGTASVTYYPLTGTYTFLSATATPAILDISTAILRGVTAITGTSALFVDTSGNISTAAIGGTVVGPGSSFTTITAAIAATAAGGYITVLPGTYTENISLSKNLTIVGSGNGTVLNGTLTFASGSAKSSWSGFSHGANTITINSGVTGINLTDFYVTARTQVTDNNSNLNKNFVQGFEG